MRLAVGDGLTDSGPELEPILDAIADFLDKDAVAAELIAGIQELIFCGVVDVVAIDGKFQRVGRMSKGIGKAKLLVVGLVLIAIVKDVEFWCRDGDEARAIDDFLRIKLAAVELGDDQKFLSDHTVILLFPMLQLLQIKQMDLIQHQVQ